MTLRKMMLAFGMIAVATSAVIAAQPEELAVLTLGKCEYVTDPSIQYDLAYHGYIEGGAQSEFIALGVRVTNQLDPEEPISMIGGLLNTKNGDVVLPEYGVIIPSDQCITIMADATITGHRIFQPTGTK